MLKSVYRNARQCAILLLCSAIGVSAQSSRAPKISKGPRALGLVQLDGKSARLIPVVIMVDGTLYDASVYRATPRPMALEPGTVYEVQRSGSPVGLFTVGDAQQIGETWYGLGDWQPAGAAQQAKAAPPLRSSASSIEDQPPILRRSGGGPGSNSRPASPPPPAPNKGQSSSDDSSKSGSSSTSTQRAPSSEGDQPPILRRPTSTSANSSTAAPPSPATSSPATSSPITSQEDSDRPVLRRGKPAQEGPQTAAAGKSSTANSLGTRTRAGSEAGSQKRLLSQFLPAISDAAGPEARPFTFFFKPGEETQFQKRLQAIARRAINTYEKVQQPNLVATGLQPGTFHALDLDFSNQPVFVYTTQTTLVARASSARAGSGRRSAKPSQEGGISNTGAATPQELDAYTTVVARVDIYGDLKEIFSSVTDSRHLDEIPRLELIDAVDVDGDERGELLFSELTDAGHAYVIYRVTPNHLTKLFDSSGVGP